MFTVKLILDEEQCNSLGQLMGAFIHKPLNFD
jgi:hypothetical protein